MRKPKSVMIDFDLFIQIYECISGQTNDTLSILSRLDDKIDSLLRREVYSRYVAASTFEEKKKLREEYVLACAGVFPDPEPEPLPDPEPEPEPLSDPEPQDDYFEYIGDFSDYLPF